MVLFKNKILLVLIAGFTVRIISIFFFGDSVIDKEWGAMLFNLENNQMLSSRSVDGLPVPNLFMPPLYAFFLYLIKIISGANFFVIFCLSTQLLISTISIFLFYKILLEFFNNNYSLVGTFIYTFFPLNIYAVSQISSITLQMLLLNIFFLTYIKVYKNLNYLNSLIFSLTSGLLILLRGEFFIFVFLSLVYLALSNKQFVKILVILILISLIISPYVKRNYEIFEVITITKSTGFNLLKGNNPLAKVEGVPIFGDIGGVIPEVKSEIDKLKKEGPIPKHDLIKDQILLNQAINFIKDDPSRYLKLYGQKFLSYLFIDFNSTYPNYYSFYHILPKILLSLTTLIGVILAFRIQLNIMNYFIFFYFANIGLFSIFFILPRYSLILLPIQVILSLEGLRILIRKVID